MSLSQDFSPTLNRKFNQNAKAVDFKFLFLICLSADVTVKSEICFWITFCRVLPRLRTWRLICAHTRERSRSVARCASADSRRARLSPRTWGHTAARDRTGIKAHVKHTLCKNSNYDKACLKKRTSLFNLERQLTPKKFTNDANVVTSFQSLFQMQSVQKGILWQFYTDQTSANSQRRKTLSVQTLLATFLSVWKPQQTHASSRKQRLDDESTAWGGKEDFRLVYFPMLNKLIPCFFLWMFGGKCSVCSFADLFFFFFSFFFFFFGRSWNRTFCSSRCFRGEPVHNASTSSHSRKKESQRPTNTLPDSFCQGRSFFVAQRSLSISHWIGKVILWEKNSFDVSASFVCSCRRNRKS